MHYIRLLRPVVLSGSADKKAAVRKGPLSLAVALTITTDLGDTFLDPVDSVPLFVHVLLPRPSDTSPVAAARPGVPALVLRHDTLVWTSGCRVLKADVPVPASLAGLLDPASRTANPVLLGALRICVSTLPSSLTTAAHIVSPATPLLPILPVWCDLRHLQHPHHPTSMRTLLLGPPSSDTPILQVAEDIGESIARHIWDAGLVAAAALAHPDATSLPQLHAMLRSAAPLHVLELGCGVGILGVALALVLRRTHGGAWRVLLTDLPEAAARAQSNIAAAQLGDALTYTDLDWAARVLPAPVHAARPWRLVVLSDCTYNVDVFPALVSTLNALHAENQAAELRVATRVLMATKPRHESERALFRMMAESGWTVLENTAVPVPVVRERDPERGAYAVEMYLFEKGG